jgi:hypothetical protein
MIETYNSQLPEKRREPRFQLTLSVLIWGIDGEGRRFAQTASAHNVSGHGALFSGVDYELRSGDLVGVQYREKQAKFRVVWTRLSRNDGKVQVAVQRLAHEECPWQEVLPAVRNEFAAARSAD